MITSKTSLSGRYRTMGLPKHLEVAFAPYPPYEKECTKGDYTAFKVPYNRVPTFFKKNGWENRSIGTLLVFVRESKEKYFYIDPPEPIEVYLHKCSRNGFFFFEERWWSFKIEVNE